MVVVEQRDVDTYPLTCVLTDGEVSYACHNDTAVMSCGNYCLCDLVYFFLREISCNLEADVVTYGVTNG